MIEKAYHDRDGVIWVDGEFVDWRETKIHVLTHSLHYGSCVFEGNRAYGGEIFRLNDHSKRLVNSAKLLGYEIPYTLEQIDQACIDTLEKSGLKDAYIRPFAWRGSDMMGVASKNNQIHFGVAAWHWGSYFADKMQGVRLCISDWIRPDPRSAPCKSKAAGLYMICTLAKDKAQAEGWDDALMYDYKGRVAECTGAHIFFVRNGELHTPTNDILLEGITCISAIFIRQSFRISTNVSLLERLRKSRLCARLMAIAILSAMSHACLSQITMIACAVKLASQFSTYAR